MLSSAHPVTVYGFVLALCTLAAMVALTVNGNVSADVSVPIITALGAGGVGAGAGIARPNTTSDTNTGTVGYADPNA